MADRLSGKKVAFLATQGVEQVELTEPWKTVENEGGTPELISLESWEIQGFEHLDHGKTFEVDKTMAEADESDYDGENAGGTWVDEEVHVDSGLVTSRNPDDLPAFCDKLAKEICEGRHQAQQTAGAGARQ